MFLILYVIYKFISAQSVLSPGSSGATGRHPAIRPPILLVLTLNEPRVFPVPVQQLVVTPTFDHTPFLQDDDLIAIADRAEPMGDDQAGTLSLVQMLKNSIFSVRVQGAGDLVEDQDDRVTE